ncbi:hypothetical protein [Marinivivus vitaminiproducens]|uniref:hypothetical protein n=1 Tax=Marinivivus vitaminiproducens TaxID=3035935 RepID=UPI00279E9B4F|nr:hypothetical protein P4R82_18130 [Geminicoccaceae bacterium SCSIO 64248]
MARAQAWHEAGADLRRPASMRDRLVSALWRRWGAPGEPKSGLDPFARLTFAAPIAQNDKKRATFPEA